MCASAIVSLASRSPTTATRAEAYRDRRFYELSPGSVMAPEADDRQLAAANSRQIDFKCDASP